MDKGQIRELIAKRVAKEFNDGDVVNLGIGLPTLVANYLPDDIDVLLQSENGFVGLGPAPEEGKEKIVIDGQTFLLEKPLKADVALIHATVVDEKGNCYHAKATKNFNPLMATAADIVIVEAEKVVPVGELDPDMVNTPSLFVDYIVEGDK